MLATTSNFSSRNTPISSRRKESYFVKSTPRGLEQAQFLAVNKDGSVLYGLRFRIQLSIIELPEQAPEVLTEATEKTVCKYHVASGSQQTFHLDDDIDPLQLTRILEFYVLAEDLVVILSYDTEQFQFTQMAVHLEKRKAWAQTVATRRMTVSRVAGPPIINLSFLDRGRILLCGARNTVEGRSERMTLSISADPLSSWKRKDEDLSALMEDFNTFLSSRTSETDGNSLIGLFLLDLDDERISILLSQTLTEDPNSPPLLSTNFIGVIDRKDNKFSVKKIDNSAIANGEPLRVTSIANLKVKNGSLWMSFSLNDVEKLKTLYWRFKHLYVRIMLRLMIIGFHGSLYLWRFDNGLSFYCLTRILTFLHGPTMIPIYSPQRKFHLCYLSMERLKFFRFNHSARVLKSKRDPNDTDFAVNFDVDSSGGAVVVDFPTEEEKNEQMIVSYYPNPTEPQTLAKMTTYSAYKHFPSFEKCSLLRRMTGILDWKWTV
ncbi:unnamed protein product [Caenorhabditis sp. 36 PRJEB53466]|nr:unnamed protein product [Caenorhabditis sp. 36 PRJEB53466]